MDTPEKPKRPWWRKKRWVAALMVAAFPFFYELSSGPILYCYARGWPPGWDVYDTFYPAPVFTAEYYIDRWTGGNSKRGLRRSINNYRNWWLFLAERHSLVRRRLSGS